MKVLHQMHHWTCFGVVCLLVLEVQKASISVSILLFCAPLPREWGCTVRPLSSLNQLLKKLMPWLHSALDFWLSLKHSVLIMPNAEPGGSTPFLQHGRTSGFIAANLRVCSAAYDLSSHCTFFVCSIRIFFHLIALCMSYPSVTFYPWPPEVDDHPVGAPSTDLLLACELWLKNCSTCACWNCLPGITLTY